MTYVVAIDNGSQSTKVSVVDASGRVHAFAQVPLRPYEHPAPGHVVHPGDDVWESIAAACTAALAGFHGDPAEIVAVGLCTIRFCRAMLRADGTLAEPMLSWMDDRVSAPHRPSADVRWVTTSSGYVTRRLTAEWRDTAANYQGVWPIDQATWRWPADGELYAATGMDREMLFELVDPGDLLGTVTPEAAARTGLPTGLPVYATANDKAVEALGCGLRAETLLSLGTYIAAMTTGDELVTETGGAFWTNFASVPGRYLYESNGIRRGMWTISWFRNLIGDLVGAGPELDAGAAAVPAGSGGLVTLLDWLAPTDHPHRRGALLGFDGTQGRFHVYRSLLEAIALTMREHTTAMDEALGRTGWQRLIVSGGGSRSDVVMQILADVFDRPAVRPHNSDAAGIGAAICAAVGSGLHPGWDEARDAMVRDGTEFRPDPATVERYREIARRRAGVLSFTDPLFEHLAR